MTATSHNSQPSLISYLGLQLSKFPLSDLKKNISVFLRLIAFDFINLDACSEKFPFTTCF